MVRHMVQEVPSGDAVEITCTQMGAHDGCWMGYAIKYGGQWDGWVASRHDHGTLTRIASDDDKAKVIEAIVENWGR